MEGQNDQEAESNYFLKSDATKIINNEAYMKVGCNLKGRGLEDIATIGGRFTGSGDGTGHMIDPNARLVGKPEDKKLVKELNVDPTFGGF